MLYKRMLRPLLFRFDPETAHNIAMFFLRVANKFVPEDLCFPSMPCEVAGIKFPNPIGLAAGFDKDAEVTRPLASLGFGFIEVGTITPQPQPGNEKPRLFRIPKVQAIINRMGFNSCGVDQAVINLLSRARGIPVGINVGPNKGTEPDKVVPSLLPAMDLLHPFADYFVLNLSSPNTPGLRDLLWPGMLNDTIKKLVTGLENLNIRIPLFLKLSPDMIDEDIMYACDVAINQGLAGLIATNTTTSRCWVPAEWRDEAGGLSGLPLNCRANDVLSLISQTVSGKIAIIASGGVMTPDDAFKKFELGASLVQVYTGLVYEGPWFVRNLVNGLKRILAEKRLESIGSVRG